MGKKKRKPPPPMIPPQPTEDSSKRVGKYRGSMSKTYKNLGMKHKRGR